MNENMAYRTIRTKRVGTFKRIVIVLGILIFLLGLSGVLFEQIQLKSAKYVNAVNSDRFYMDLADKYASVDLTIAFRQGNPKAQAEGKRWETKYREEWEDFDQLVAYYSQSNERHEQLEKIIDEYRIRASIGGNISRAIEDIAEESRFTGIVFMSIGGALFIPGILLALRDLRKNSRQLDQQHENKTKQAISPWNTYGTLLWIRGVGTKN